MFFRKHLHVWIPRNYHQWDVSPSHYLYSGPCLEITAQCHDCQRIKVFSIKGRMTVVQGTRHINRKLHKRIAKLEKRVGR